MLHGALQHLREHLEVRGQQLCLNVLPRLPPPRPTHPQGPVAATALLGRRARRLAPTSLLLSNSQSAKLGDLAANCVVDGLVLRI